MSRDDIFMSAGRERARTGGAVNPPVYRASTFLFDTVEAFDEASKTPFDVQYYGRVGTPTTFAFESAIAAAEGGHRCIATSSGLSAIVATLVAFTGQGDHILVVDSVYDPVRRACTRMLPRFGVDVTYYDPYVGAGIAALIRPNTKLIYLEAPGSGTFEMQDIPAIVGVAKARGVATAMDNTWATPLFFQPLRAGVDVSIHSATKYIVGHSDAMLGVVTTNEPSYDAVRKATVDLGACAGSEELYLGLRGLRTLKVRMERHQASALKVAEWLRGQPQVLRVFHPGLPDNPGHALWKRDFRGACGLFGIELKPGAHAAVAALIDGLKCFKIGFSWGGYESLVLPTHPERSRTAVPWKADGPTLRFHIGLEDVDTLIDDLRAGLERYSRAA